MVGFNYNIITGRHCPPYFTQWRLTMTANIQLTQSSAGTEPGSMLFAAENNFGTSESTS